LTTQSEQPAASLELVIFLAGAARAGDPGRELAGTGAADGS
jgi:hypothetical protein